MAGVAFSDSELGFFRGGLSPQSESIAFIRSGLSPQSESIAFIQGQLKRIADRLELLEKAVSDEKVRQNEILCEQNRVMIDLLQRILALYQVRLSETLRHVEIAPQPTSPRSMLVQGFVPVAVQFMGSPQPESSLPAAPSSSSETTLHSPVPLPKRRKRN